MRTDGLSDNSKRGRAPLIAAGVAASMLAGTHPALAQRVPPPPDDQIVGEITVTAQRREQNAQEVPIAVTALSADRLDEDAARNLDRIGADVPNLYLARNFGTSSGALVFLRGVGEGDSIFTNDPPVGIYVDDVILPRATGALLDLIDVERIEVLRGPQGTLYGRNTSGGAIKLVTKRPGLDRSGGVADAAVGSYGRVDVRGTLNVPVSGNVAVRVSGLSRNGSGWGRNLVDRDRVNGQDTQAGRVSLLWQPDTRLTLVATGDFTRDRSRPRFPQRFVPNSGRQGRSTNQFAMPDGDIDRFVSPDTDPLGDTDTGGASLRSELKLGSGTLTAISGWRFLRSRIGFDQTATAPGVGSNVILLQDQRQRSFSQEVQFAGTALGSRVDLLAGLFYFREHNDQLTAVSFASPVGSAGGRYRTDDFFVAPSRGVGTSGNWSPYEPRLDTQSYAAFGSATVKIGERASLTGGVRGTIEHKAYGVRFLAAPDTTLVLPDGQRAERRIADTWRDVSPRVAADYRLGGDRWRALAYVSYAKGFRSGSFDARARNIDFALRRQGAIAPETVWSAEAGLKTDLLGGRLRVNGDYFINRYTNIAFSAARAGVPPEIFRQNVGDARLQGVEIESSARLPFGVELGGWIATLTDRFTRLSSSPGCTAFVADERDLDLRFTPAFRYQARASIRRPLAGGHWRVGGDISGASSYNIALCNEPQHRVTNAETANAQIGYERGDWSLVLSATNLTDRRFNTGSVGTIGYPQAPRELLVQLRRVF